MAPLSNKTWSLLVAGALVAILLVPIGIDSSRTTAKLLPGGTAVFYRGHFLHHEKCDLYVSPVRNWAILCPNGAGGELIVPFESAYNKYRTLRFESGGRVYLIDRRNMTREELRVVNGEWSYDATDHWQSIFDLDVDF